MVIEIVAIGSELVARRAETNSLEIAEKLATIGLVPSYKTVVGDDSDALERALRDSLSRSDLVIATGGLGPTFDDITKKTIARIFNTSLVLDEEALEKIKGFYKMAGRKMTGNAESQALIPANARSLGNPVGSAPGFVVEDDGKVLISLPGVPREMRAIMDSAVMPFLAERFPTGKVYLTRTLKICGLWESQVDDLLRPVLKKISGVEVGVTAHVEVGEIHITLRAEGRDKDEAWRTIEAAEREIHKVLGDHIYGSENQRLEDVVGYLLQMKGLTIATAESCTGGLLGHRLTNVPGSSQYFMRGVIAYSNKAKQRLLRVPAKMLKEYGAVSEPVARQMASQIRESAGADIGVGITGIAGPTGGTPEKPVGLVYVALSTPEGVKCEKHNLRGDRETIKFRSTQVALTMVRTYLLEIKN
ncbi:MAG: competence/damage-inducible protein A [bacterium]